MTNKQLIGSILGGAMAAAIATGSSLSAGAAANPSPRAHAVAATQTIDAKTNPAEAAKTLNGFCQVLSNCKFVNTAPITVHWGPYRILGDVLYNCGKTEAEDEVSISDERSESWSFDESVSLKVKLGFLGLAKASVETEVNSKQLDEVATTVEHTNTVAVAPDTLGFTESRVPTADVTGSADITSGVNVYKVTNIELTYPGFGDKDINKIDWTDFHHDMTAQDRQEHCARLPALYPTTATRSG